MEIVTTRGERPQVRSERLPVRRRYLFFLLAALGVLMAAIDSTIVAVAIPQLSEALDAPLAWVSWTLTGYQLVQVTMLPVAGKLSDTLGRKRVFMACIGLFTLGSLLCGLAPSIGLLVLFRAVQAVGGGGLMPSAVGIVSDQFTERRAQAIGLFSSVFPIGGIIGPNLGGFILHYWSWRDLFFVNVPLGVAVLIGIYLLLPGSRGERRKAHIDLKGLGLFATALAGLLFGMTRLANEPALAASPLLWGLFAGSAALLALFLRHLRTAPDPLVDYELVARNPFLAANLYNFVFGAAAFGFFSFVPYYAVVRYGMSALESGAVLTPRAMAMMAVSTVSSLYIIRLGYRLPMIVGALLMAASLLLLSQGPHGVELGGLTLSAFWGLAATLALSGAGMGICGPAANNAAIDLVPRKAAAITGLRGMFRQTGGVIGIATIVLALSFFPDQGQGLSIIFLVLAGIFLVTIPLTLLIPDTARERWRRERHAAEEPS